MTDGSTDTDTNDGRGVLRIGCDDCVMAHTDSCEDCLVTFVHTAGEPVAVVLDLDEFRALRRLQQAGLVPENRHVVAEG